MNDTEQKNSKPVTVADIKTAAGFIAVLATVIFFGAGLQSDGVQTKRDLSELKENYRNMAEKQNTMNDKITRIETILTTAQNNGQIGKARTQSTVALAAPYIAAQEPAPKQASYNSVFLEPKTQPEPVPTPTPTPTAKPGLINSILGLF